MLTTSKIIDLIPDTGGSPSIKTTSNIITKPTVGISDNMSGSQTVSSFLNITNEPIFVNNSYTARSNKLLRNLYIVISNEAGDSFTFKNCKIEVRGQKYIGIQQDMFSITLKNINLQAFASAINRGYIFIRVVVDERVVFAGSIKNINTARENVVERTMTLNCLLRVTDLLSDIVSPITVNSSMNVWHVLNIIDPFLTVEIPEAIRDLKFDDDYTFTGQKKTVIDDIIKILNNQLNRTNIKDLPWLDYELRQDGTLSLFGPTDHVEILNVQPYTGLTDAPQVGDLEITFNSIYKYKFTPGRIVKLNNALFATSGTDSAFIYAFDENGLYVITDVSYSFSNYPWKFNVSCKARPLSKYQNFVVK